MQLLITRVGGMLPTLRPHKKYNFDELQPAIQAALLSFMRRSSSASTAPHPDHMSYVFELDSEAQRLTTSAGYDAVPKLIQALLPGPL